jgi:hypothetical protein
MGTQEVQETKEIVRVKVKREIKETGAQEDHHPEEKGVKEVDVTFSEVETTRAEVQMEMDRDLKIKVEIQVREFQEMKRDHIAGEMRILKKKKTLILKVRTGMAKEMAKEEEGVFKEIKEVVDGLMEMDKGVKIKTKVIAVKNKESKEI